MKIKSFRKLASYATIMAMLVQIFSSAMPALAATASGPNNASTVVDNNAIGSYTWSNPSNARISNNQWASAVIDNGGNSTHYLKATGYGFSIPAGATINGIVANVEKHQTCTTSGCTSSVLDNSVRLVKSNNVVGSNRADNVTPWAGSDAVKSYGSNSDLWGTTWTVSDINNGNFGLAFSATRNSGGDRTVYVDEMSITVYYTAADKTAPIIQSHADVEVLATSAAGAYVNYTAPLATDNVDATAPATCLPASGSLFPIGTTAVNCFKTDAAGNNAAPTQFNVIVTAEAPVITLLGNNPETITAGDTYVDAGASASDSIDGDITGLITTVNNVDSNNVGTYTIDYSVTDSVGKTATAQRTVNVIKRSITITADYETKVYGQSDPYLNWTCVNTSNSENGCFIDDNDITGALTRVPGENTGTYAISQGTLQADDNYDLTFVGANFEITPATLTVTANDQTKTYGEADPTFTFSYDGFVFEDNGSSITEPTCAVATPHVNVGTYNIVCSEGESANYVFDYQNGSLTIKPAHIEVKADQISKVHGTADPALTYKITSGALVGSDAFTGSIVRAGGEDVNSYLITLGTLTLNDNYWLDFVNGVFTITPVPATTNTPQSTETDGGSGLDTAVLGTQTNDKSDKKSNTKDSSDNDSDPEFLTSTWMGIYNWIWLLLAAAAVFGGTWWLLGFKRRREE